MPEKLVRKWLLDDIADIDRNESWLSDLAEEGLFLDHLGSRFAYFKRDTPRAMRYRFDVLSRTLTEDELGVYDACGWHFVTLYNESSFCADVIYYVFTTDESATVPELHTDPMEQAASLKHLHRKSVVDLIWMIVLTVLLAGVQIYIHTAPGMLFNYLVNGSINYSLLYLALYVFYIWQSGRRYLAVRRLQKHLSNGQLLDHHAPYQAARKKGVVANTFFWGIYVVWFAALILGLMTIDTQNERAIPEELSFPAMRVADIYAPREPEGTVSGKWYHSWYVSGVKKDTIAETEHSGTRFIHLNTTCYTLPFAFESRSVLLGLMDQTHYFYEQAQELETNLMDEVWVAKSSRESDSSYLFARSGRYVFEIYYANGTRDITELLPLLADKLNG